MKKTTTLKKALTGAFSVLILADLTSCQDEDFGNTSKEISYNKAIAETLGNIDPEQTWINAEQGVVTINGSYQHIRVFDGMTRRVIADYENVQDGDKIYYNATPGYKPIISNGFKAIEITSGDEVSFSDGTRAISATAATDITIVSTTTNPLSLTSTDMTSFYSTLPEEQNNVKEDIKTNFEYVSDNPIVDGKQTFTVYPLYWGTHADLTVGIYYYDPSTGKVVDGGAIYKNRAGNTQLKGYYIRGWYNVGHLNGGKVMFACENGSQGDHDYGSWKPTVGYSKFESYGIQITVPENLIFGFYVQQTVNNKNVRFYSNVTLNDNCTSDMSCKGGHHAATFEGNRSQFKNATYLGFEDWNNSVTDLNDMMLVIDGVTPIEYVDQAYMMAFEDMAMYNYTQTDLDFNDCVLTLTAVNGKSDGYLTLNAAGGQVKINVDYNGNDVFGEIHTALGGTYRTPINTDADNLDAAYVMKGITLPTQNFDIKAIAAKIKLKVTELDGTTTHEVVIEYDANDKTKSPEGFVIAANNWKWPAENQNIVDAYPAFKTWAGNHTFTNWYDYNWDGK